MELISITKRSSFLIKSHHYKLVDFRTTQFDGEAMAAASTVTGNGGFGHERFSDFLLL